MADIKKGRLIFFVIASTLTITFVFYGYQIVFTANILVEKEDRIFYVKKGDTFQDVQKGLYDGGFVNDPVSFSFLARWMEYDRSVHPGRFLLRANSTNLEAIRTLRAGVQVPVNITFNNVRLISELAEKITRNTSIDPAEFDAAIDRFVNENNEGFTKENVIAMFIPNTYEVYFNLSADELVQRMHSEYKNFWNADRIAKAKALGLTPLEVSTLASIVQAENTRGDEAATIAGLYINRLKKDMPLQADPTLVFAVGDFGLKRILNVHKEVDSPYNTYTHAGLPPGPINMPEIKSIDGVLNYEKHNYLYMCAKEDFSGRHNFASNLTAHNQNARKYQRALTIEQQKGREARAKKK
ncbi:MAG: endolytic transglycosylase MltG [Bacteroidota bacterium]